MTVCSTRARRLVHLGGVGGLVGGFEGLPVALPPEARQELLQQARGRGPPVRHEILLGALAGDDAEVVLPSPPGPVLAVGAHVPGGGAAVVAYVHGGGGALEDVEVCGVLGKHGDDLDAGGPGADDAHPLVREAGHAAPGVPPV